MGNEYPTAEEWNNMAIANRKPDAETMTPEFRDAAMRAINDCRAMRPIVDAAMLVVKHSAVTGEAAGRHGLYVHVTIDADAWRALKAAAEEVERG